MRKRSECMQCRHVAHENGTKLARLAWNKNTRNGKTHTHTGTLNESSAEQRNEKRKEKKWKTRRTEKYAENRGIIEMCTFLNKHVEKPKSQCFWSSAHCIISFYLLAWKLLLPFLWLLLCFIWLRARCFHSGVFFGCVRVATGYGGAERRWHLRSHWKWD